MLGITRETHGPLVLASASPRRRALIAALDAPAELVAPRTMESPPRNGESPEDYVLRLSGHKASEVAGRYERAVVLGADTIVTLDGQVFGKPDSETAAVQMLARLRGKTHRVITGVTALDVESGRSAAAAVGTGVTMRWYSEEEIEAYVASGDALDKAGAYAVQDDVFNPGAPRDAA